MLNCFLQNNEPPEATQNLGIAFSGGSGMVSSKINSLIQPFLQHAQLQDLTERCGSAQAITSSAAPPLSIKACALLHSAPGH